MTRWLVGMGLWLACGPSDPTELPMPPRITCHSGADLATADGREVTLVGVYQQARTQIKKGSPGVFRGEAQILLRGKASDANPTAWDGPMVVRLGQRPADEVARLEGETVRAHGVLNLDPYREAREKGGDVAMVISGPPRLDHVTSVAP